MGTNGQSESLNQVTRKAMYYIESDEHEIINHRRIHHKVHLSGLYPGRRRHFGSQLWH
jgi:hypothetical protein